MDASIVAISFPRGSESYQSVRCLPAGKRRVAAWLEDEFLGHAIASVDGTWSGKTPDEVTHPGSRGFDDALTGLLELRARVRALMPM